MKDNLNPNRTYSNRSAIRLPENNARRSALNLDFLVLVRQNPFPRVPAEHPHDYIEKLDDYNRCKIFSFSLKGDARRWLDQLPAGFMTCCREIRSTFIYNFYDETRYWEERNKLFTFSQGIWESLKNAWGRFTKYQLECPHHGYSES